LLQDDHGGPRISPVIDFLIDTKEHDQRDDRASYESHLAALKIETESLTNSLDKTREQPDVVPSINGLISQIEGDPTGCAGEQGFLKANRYQNKFKLS